MEDLLFVLYVNNQEKSTSFYSRLLEIKPSLNVPGMTEFTLNSNTKLGLMSEKGIGKILKDKVAPPESGNGIPRCELYLRVQFPDIYIQRGIELGAKLISKNQDRDWGERVGYIIDEDGHIIAFAEKKD